ncbi:PIG-L family deacetylase [Lutimonas saemankumensis]|uniref:PIG-L deacetylase family protein n=1 Tax=Lutimonas saemankumensis TaxID=483016 RepID=UPI001CD78C6D|nr:PIG-L family deacetylase [Lutimonas saemankumensis]MCA0931067.1 PIG-L family deacetylase [Lutimonas saemankumensis]
MKNILILSPHTDDAELGCGALISRFVEEEKNILWVVFSTAEESIPKEMSVDTLKNEFLNVVNKLNISKKNVIINHFKVRYLHEKRQEILELLVKIRNSFQPELVIGPSLNDFHQDHQIVANEMVRAFKSSSSIISYELPWNHITFNTQLFFKCEKRHLRKKIELLQCYKSQIVKNRSYFSEEFINGLARTRGVQVNSEYAEAFEVIKWIV